MTKVFATQDFNDSGTGKSFFAGKEVDATEGEIANYKAAGLVSDQPIETAKAAKAADAKGTAAQ